MKIDIVEEGSFHRKIECVVPAAMVKVEVDKAFRVLGKRAKLRGFRPGKAPRHVLEMQFGDQVRSDVLSQLIQSAYSEALTQHELEPVGQPSVEKTNKVNPEEDLNFVLSVDIRPEVSLKKHGGFDINYPLVKPTDNDVEEAIRLRLESKAKLVTVEERGVETSDLVLIELDVREGETEKFKEPGIMIRMEAEPYFTGIESHLEGMKVGDEKTETVQFAETAKMMELAGQEYSVQMKVLSIQTQEVPELTEEMAEELGYGDGVSGMRAMIRTELERSMKEQARRHARMEVLEALVKANPMDIPGGMIEQNLESLKEDLAFQHAYRTGGNPQDVTFSEEQDVELRKRAEFNGKAGLILETLIKDQSISVTEEDLEAKYQEISETQNDTIEAVRNYFAKPQAQQSLRGRLIEDKTVTWVLDQCKLISPEGS